MIRHQKPRFVVSKRLKNGEVGFYFYITAHYRRLGCSIPNEPLGTDYTAAFERAKFLNELFDEWDSNRSGKSIDRAPRYGTVDWLFREYKISKAYLEKVSPRSRPDYERTMLMVSNVKTKTDQRIGDYLVSSISPRGADKIYDMLINGPRGKRLRQAEKAVALCRKAWRVVRRLYPKEFDSKVPNPWEGITKKTRVKATKAAVTRDQVYQFAWGCIERGRPEPAAAAVICFEWLQRPENVIGGYIRWTDYRSNEWPSAIRIEHHKTGALVWHPLEETVDGNRVLFYPQAEAVLSKLPKRGVPMIMRDVDPAKLYSIPGMQKAVQALRKEIGLPDSFTLDACRHGGMTELEVAELTDGQGRALSGHKTRQAYAGYAKSTLERALPATRKRHAHLNGQGTTFRNNDAAEFRNENAPEKTSTRSG